jgi:hypothetical protein
MASKRCSGEYPKGVVGGARVARWQDGEDVATRDPV